MPNKGSFKPFCKYGHDRKLVGVGSYGECNACRRSYGMSAEQKKRNSEYRKKNRSARNEYLRQWRKSNPEKYLASAKKDSKHTVQKLRPHYLRATMRLKKDDIAACNSDLISEILEIQALKIKLKRELKNAINQNRK